MRELLHPEEDSITSRDELFNNFDGGDVLENRMFWLSGDIFLKLSQTMCINRLGFFQVKETFSPSYTSTMFIFRRTKVWFRIGFFTEILHFMYIINLGVQKWQQPPRFFLNQVLNQKRS